jgi:purine-cytosine permease-like protein
VVRSVANRAGWLGINVEAAARQIGEIPTLHNIHTVAIVHAIVLVPTVKRISGHKNLSIVERYSHQNGTHIEDIEPLACQATGRLRCGRGC